MTSVPRICGAGARSLELFQRGALLMPGGVNSPVRAFRSVGGDPLFIQGGHGPWVRDVDGHEYLDMVSSWGPLILGHAHPRVVEAIARAAARGTSFGAPCELEVRMAETLCLAVPGLEMVRLVNSGTEASMSALRVARGFTGRDRVVKFAGCYHGHVDSLLVKAGSGALTLGCPDSAGVPAEVAADTLVLPFNDEQAVRTLLEEHGSGIAALIVEPVPANMGVVPPRPGFLAFLREITERHGILLIFDEVITGFRVAWGGAQEWAGVVPDMTILGKIIGGGMPVGAYGGRREIMQCVAPLGPVYQAGTLSGNPVAMAAGLETLRIIHEDEGFYARLEERGAWLEEHLLAAAGDAGVGVTAHRVGSMSTLFFTSSPVHDYESARQADTALYARFFRGMLAEGVAMAPSQFEAMFISAAHEMDHLERVATAARRVFSQMQPGAGER